MLLRLYLYTIFFLTLIFWATSSIFIFYINPFKSDTTILSIFFVSLFSALFGTITLLGFYLRIKFTKKEAVFEYLKLSLRQGALIAALALGILGFFALGIFTWWTAVLFFIIIILLELILRSK